VAGAPRGINLFETCRFVDVEPRLAGRSAHHEAGWDDAGGNDGAGDDLNVYQRPYARTSALNCREHQMVLPGYALMAQGTQIHAALWPGDDAEDPPESPWPLSARQELLSRAFAAQGACYVVGVGGLMTPEDMPKRFRGLAGESTGDSIIIDPRGEVVARAASGEETMLKARRSIVRTAKSVNDIAGHYSRPDVFGVTAHGEATSSLRPFQPPGDESER
jgi:nitrilase